MHLSLVLPLLVCAQAFSSGGDTAEDNSVICDAKHKNYGDQEQKEASGKIMWWTKPAVHTTNYTLRTGDGIPSKDPISFVPGQWMEIHIRTHVPDKQFTGLLLYGVDENEMKVGEWAFRPDSGFWLPKNDGCDGKSVLHTSASKFAYHEEFRFRPPVNMTGSLTFRCLLKYGLAFPSLDGSFFWPNKKDVTLTNAGRSATKQQIWFSGKEGESCSQACYNAGVGCSQDKLDDMASDPGKLKTEISIEVPSFEPLFAGCSSAHPYFVQGSLVAFLDSTCAKQSQCSGSVPGKSRICPCGEERAAQAPGGGNLSTSGSTKVSRELSSMDLLILVLLLSSSSTNSRQKLPLFAASLFGCLLMLPFCSAHNWINNPSRTGKLSMIHPCPARNPDAPPHMQVGPGQKFPVEWATGHNGYSWFAIVLAKDQDKLKTHSETIFHDYIKNAPELNKGYMADENKYRVFSGKFSYAPVGPLLYPKGSFSGDKIKRPDVFPFRFGSTDDKAIYKFEDHAKHHASTVRAAYNNPDYPWIVAVHGFKITHKNPKEADIANIEIPAGSPSGRYIIHWMWRGYRDCIDVNVLAKPSTDIWGTSAGTTWERTEHCQYRNEFMRQDKFHTSCVRIDRAMNASSLLKTLRTNRNMAANVVPWRQPKGLFADLKASLGAKKNSPRCSFWKDRELNAEGTGGWTGFVSLAYPRRDRDDERRTLQIWKDLLPCEDPIAIECRRKNDSVAWDQSKAPADNYCDVAKGLYSTTGVDWEVRYQCKLFNDLDAKLAYAFEITPAQLEVGAHKDVSADPEDPVFFSTCYKLHRVRKFADKCVACKPAEPERKYVFGNRCVSCEATEQPFDNLRDATWEFPDQCKECTGM